MESVEHTPPSVAQRDPSGIAQDSVQQRRGASFNKRAHDARLQIGQTDLSNLSIIESIPDNRRVTVEVQNVSAFVPNFNPQGASLRQQLNPLNVVKKGAGSTGDGKPAMRQILFNVRARIPAGEVLALMGPSGSGKTTLLSILGARAQKSMKVQGEVLFNGQLLTKKLKRQVGYVMQDDLLYEALTVHETLSYAAALRLPRDMSAADRAARVDDVITGLSLGSCRDTIVGGFFRKGISGGERKRTSVGHELLINPSIMFLDEPTSGLDSTTAMHLLEMLQYLARGGRVIVTTIHQPSSRLYQTLDNLMLLSRGHCLYHGRAKDVVDWFDALGYTLPYRVNVADFILDLASADVSSPERNGEETREYLVECSELFLARHPTEGFNAKRDIPELRELARDAEADSRGVSVATIPIVENGVDNVATKVAGLGEGHGAFHVSSADDVETGAGGPGDEARNGVPAEDRWGASYGSQIRILFQRSLRTRRFETWSFNDILQLMVIAVLVGLFWLQKAQDDTIAASRNTVGLLFFELIFLSFRTMFTAIFTFPGEQRMMLKERASGMYRLSAFYFARLMSDWPMDFSLPTLYIIIVYFMAGLRYSASAFFANYFTVILVMLVAQSIGLLIGTLVMNPKAAQTYATIIMLTSVLMAGFLVVDLPVWIGWLRYASFVYYGLGITLHVEFNDRIVYACVETGSTTCIPTNPGSPESNPECTPVTDIKSSLQLLQDPDNTGDAIRNGFILLGALIVLRIWGYFALRSKTSRL